MKKIITIFLILLFSTVTVYAIKNNFNFDTSNLSFTTGSKKQSIINNFNSDYNLTMNLEDENSEIINNIKTLTKKTTYLLFGKFNNINETSEEYYQRHQEFSKLRYNPEIPKDESTFSGYDENSQEYADSIVSSIATSNIFLQVNELDVKYNSYGDIRVITTDKFIISKIILPNIKIKEQNKEDPMIYDQKETNIVMYYFYKKLNDEYKLYYLFGKTTDDIDEYFDNVESNETSGSLSIAPSYDLELEKIYNFGKLNAMTETELNNIYTSNISNIVYLSSYYNNTIVSSANGFFITDGLLVTTWSFIEKSLINAQYIVVKNNNQEILKIDGIVTANPETDIVILKLKEKNKAQIILNEDNKISIEDPAIVISSKSGIGLTIQKGIILSIDNYIQTSIPLSSTDEGSPLFNQSGKVIGMNTSKSINTSTSLAVPSNILKEILDKFKNIDFDKLDVITFEKLKENYYYIKYNDEIINNNIPSNIWNKYSKIGNINSTIKLELIKANYKDNIVSLRYRNNISKYISGMMLATEFKEKLIKEGYNEVLNTTSKAIYKNSKYQIIIMEEFDYLIIVMVKL